MLIKALLGSVTLAALVAILPAAAAGPMDCTDANLTLMSTHHAKMTDATKKELAMKEWTLAKAMMDKKDTVACETHIKNFYTNAGVDPNRP